jgi:hypothetical protein
MVRSPIKTETTVRRTDRPTPRTAKREHPAARSGGGVFLISATLLVTPKTSAILDRYEITSSPKCFCRRIVTLPS